MPFQSNPDLRNLVHEIADALSCSPRFPVYGEHFDDSWQLAEMLAKALETAPRPS